MRKISTGAYSIPLTRPQVAFMHHRKGFKHPQVAFSIPVEGFFSIYRCRFCTTPTLATYYHYPHLPTNDQTGGISIEAPNACLQEKTGSLTEVADIPSDIIALSSGLMTKQGELPNYLPNLNHGFITVLLVLLFIYSYWMSNHE